MKQKNPNSNACCRYVVDGGDARRAPQGVILAVLNQFLKASGTKNTAYFKVFGAAQTQNHGIVTVGVVVVAAAAVVVVVARSGRKSSNSWCFRFL